MCLLQIFCYNIPNIIADMAVRPLRPVNVPCEDSSSVIFKEKPKLNESYATFLYRVCLLYAFLNVLSKA